MHRSVIDPAAALSWLPRSSSIELIDEEWGVREGTDSFT
jgi:hypothetical protein